MHARILMHTRDIRKALPCCMSPTNLLHNIYPKNCFNPFKMLEAILGKNDLPIWSKSQQTKLEQIRELRNAIAKIPYE